MIRLSLAIVVLGGCAMGVGGSYIGHWRPRDVKVFDACLVDDAGRCTDHKDVTTHVPERSFSAAIINFPSVGAASVTENGETTTRLRFDPTLEYLRGTSRYAIGLRSGFQYDVLAANAVPLVAIGHLSLTDRLAIHAGGGYVPWSRLHGEDSFVGLQALAGLQLALSRVRSQNYTAITVEADTTWIDFARPYRSTGLTGNFGVYF